MNQYVALLRGINVGGKNRVPMAELKFLFTELGYSDVQTYINSGNVLFKSSETELSILKDKIETKVKEFFSLNIPIHILPSTQLEDALKHVPSWWNQNPDDINYAIFVLDSIGVTELVESVGPVNGKEEKIFIYENIIFWSTTREYHGKTKWRKISGLSTGQHITVRNANTTLKLLNLMKPY